MSWLIVSVTALLFTTYGHANGGKFINPITDICWKCLYPIHLGGINVTPGSKDYMGYKAEVCACAGAPPKVGVPLAFWEPVALVDVTRTPYKSIALGGISLSSSTVKGRGGVSHVGDSGRHSFYNVHYYKFPVIRFLDMLPGFSCAEQGSALDITYLSELDPYWLDDNWNSVVNPEALMFANPLAQAACVPDCMSSSVDHPLDPLFWCAGCSGSLYPLMGQVSHHVGAVQASHLVVHRLLSKMHSLGMMWGAESGNYCDKKRYPRIKKSLYKTQLTYPIAAAQGPCNPLGKSDLLWGSSKSYPYEGEDFVYLLWTKKHCCLDAVEAAVAISGGGS